MVTNSSISIQYKQSSLQPIYTLFSKTWGDEKLFSRNRNLNTTVLDAISTTYRIPILQTVTAKTLSLYLNKKGDEEISDSSLMIFDFSWLVSERVILYRYESWHPKNIASSCTINEENICPFISMVCLRPPSGLVK